MTTEARQAELYNLLSPGAQVSLEGRNPGAPAGRTSRECIPGYANQDERLVSLGQHVSDIAHELKNPLTVILLQARLLNKISSSTNDMSDSLTLIQKQAQRMRRLVNDLLSFGADQPPQLEPADLNVLILRTLQLERPIVADSLQITTDLDAELPLTYVDPEQIHRVFVNLIDNASHAITEANPAVDGDGAAPGKLLITTAFIRDPEPRIQVRFADNGPGIPPDVMPYIFEPFFTTKQYGQGTGLGLSICDRIASLHGGSIWAQNNAKRGVTLILEFPVREAKDSDLPLADRAN